jgi:signal transduction histidine kinase
MSVDDLVRRLAALPNLSEIPRAELAWLAEHGRHERHAAGTVVAPKGRRIERLWILLDGHVAVRVDRGAGPRRVMAWHTGEVSGMLPYSRMTGPPGDNYCETPTELFTIDQTDFAEMTARCPQFTRYTVHLMLDRARGFTSSDLHDEKMVSLGRLAAGLAHELNNPASAALRGAKQLRPMLATSDKASRALGASRLADVAVEAIEQARAACLEPTGWTPLQRADREDEIARWLEARACDQAHAAVLAGTATTIQMLEALADAVPREALHTAIAWIAAGYETQRLSAEIEQALTRVHDLVAAVKRFTYMDQLAGPDVVDVAEGLGDTIRVLTSRAEAKRAVMALDVEADLPKVRAAGADLNQVWLCLLDNALDAVADGGRVQVAVRRDLDRVVVSIVDDGRGIPPDVMPWIFDAFFTTKPPGKGTGLGLDIARRLARRHHGDITVQSRPGCTEFRVSLVAEALETGRAEVDRVPPGKELK